MTNRRPIMGILIIFIAWIPFISTIQKLPNLNVIAIAWLGITGLLGFTFIASVRALRPLNPGKFVMAVTWAGVFVEFGAFIVVLISSFGDLSGRGSGLQMGGVLAGAAYPLIAVTVTGLCGREGRSAGAVWAAVSGILWIVNFFLPINYLLPISLSIAGCFLFVAPKNLPWVTRLRPPNKLVKIFTVVGLAGLFIIPYFALGSVPASAFPKFATHDWIELNKISSISRFRSQAGHDYSDIYESGRSMKHYFDPFSAYGSTDINVSVFSPADGVVVDIHYESHVINSTIQGFQVWIRPFAAPTFTVILFHINVDPGVFIGMPVSAGQRIGFADLRSEGYGSSSTDVAVICTIPILGDRAVSYFDVVTDKVFAAYQARGVSSRDALIIPRAVADTYVGWASNYTRDWLQLT